MKDFERWKKLNPNTGGGGGGEGGLLGGLLGELH
jgi:hypothetical protein